LDPAWKSDAHQDKGSNTSALMFDYGVMLLIILLVIVLFVHISVDILLLLLLSLFLMLFCSFA